MSFPYSYTSSLMSQVDPLEEGEIRYSIDGGETFFGYYLNRELCGVISIKVDNREIDIHRLMVHLKHFKKGIAKMLLHFIEVEMKNFEAIIVSTATKNEPAVAFYLKSGFLKREVTRKTEHLSLPSFKKKLN